MRAHRPADAELGDVGEVADVLVVADLKLFVPILTEKILAL